MRSGVTRCESKEWNTAQGARLRMRCAEANDTSELRQARCASMRARFVPQESVDEVTCPNSSRFRACAHIRRLQAKAPIGPSVMGRETAAQAASGLDAGSPWRIASELAN